MNSKKRKNDVMGNGRERTNKCGRPVKGVTEKLKYRITVKMATEDYYLLKSKAKSAGVSASEFIRGCITHGGVKERLSKEHGDLIRKLCGMANNLNQLTRLSHQAGFHRTQKTVTELLQKLKEIIVRYRHGERRPS